MEPDREWDQFGADGDEQAPRLIGSEHRERKSSAARGRAAPHQLGLHRRNGSTRHRRNGLPQHATEPRAGGAVPRQRIYNDRLTESGSALRGGGVTWRPVAPYVRGAALRLISADTPRMMPSATACAVASTVRLICSMARKVLWRSRRTFSTPGTALAR